MGGLAVSREDLARDAYGSVLDVRLSAVFSDENLSAVLSLLTFFEFQFAQSKKVIEVGQAQEKVYFTKPVSRKKLTSKVGKEVRPDRAAHGDFRQPRDALPTMQRHLNIARNIIFRFRVFDSISISQVIIS